MDTSRLSERAARSTSGVAAENVNYAVKNTFLLGLLEPLPGVDEEFPSPARGARAFEDVVKAAQQGTVRLEVYQAPEDPDPPGPHAARTRLAMLPRGGVNPLAHLLDPVGRAACSPRGMPAPGC